VSRFGRLDCGERVTDTHDHEIAGETGRVTLNFLENGGLCLPRVDGDDDDGLDLQEAQERVACAYGSHDFGGTEAVGGARPPTGRTVNPSGARSRTTT